MIKHLIFIISLAIGTRAWAGECVDASRDDVFNDVEAFTSLFAQTESCDLAVDLAESCTYGSSIDVGTAVAACEVCELDLKQAGISLANTRLRKQMESACNDKFANEEGTMYQSMNASGQLAALQLILRLGANN